MDTKRKLNVCKSVGTQPTLKVHKTDMDIT